VVNIKNELYFSPNYKFSDLNLENRNNLISAFQDRVEGYYLKPTKCLNRLRAAFATGVMCVITIDFLSRIETGINKVGKRFRFWVESNLREFEKFNQDISLHLFATRLYEEFRNGLVHEGRIKEASQFDYLIDELVIIDGPIMVINPNFLLKEIVRSFKKYINKLKTDAEIFEKFRENLKEDFQEDWEFIKKS